VLLVGEDGGLEPATIRSAEVELGSQTAAFSRSIAESVLIDGEPVITVDAARDARVSDYMSVHQLMLRSVACLPIETHGRTWGVLYLENRSASGRFAGTDLSVLRAYADQAAIAIETSLLFERVEAQRRSLERANEALRDANRHLEQRVHGQEQALEETKREIALLQGTSGNGARWGLVGVSDGMRRVYEVLERVCANDVPVVITGESGTGKELIARAIHRGSPRADGPWVSLSCASIPEGLLESELFGHVAGAFTGATRAHQGVFAQADGGTLFLDEIADMPPRMQLDLLRVLQERRVRPVGADEERPVDVRLVTASNQELRDLIEKGLLREDLYYRLAVVELKLPPLRERRSDIPLLCDHFLGKIAEERGEPRKRLSRAAIQLLCGHDFPGNVRELEHILISATVFSKHQTIEAEELTIESQRAAAAPMRGGESYRDFKDAERERIVAALNTHGWNRAQAARALGIPRRTFYRRLKEHGIELPATKG
jgi:DNA-binding NtrC family response regulator